MSRELRLLLLADTHLGFDLPRRPRIERRRRGPDFFANFARALAPALAGEVDLVVHGGDLLFRSRVPASLVARALDPLKRVADAGVPVLLVPGNHERSHIPYGLLARHPRLHLFDRPRTFSLTLAGLRLAVGGFPFVGHGLRRRFPAILAETGLMATSVDLRLLCLHQCVAGAAVGPAGFVFRRGDDVIRGGDLPRDCAGVLGGHIHRGQLLRRDLAGRPLPTPVIYPGSVERTSFAEQGERKGYWRLTFTADGRRGGRLAAARFCELPTRPMVTRELEAADATGADLRRQVRRALAGLPPDVVLRLRLRGEPRPEAWAAVSAAELRALAPASINACLVRAKRLDAGRQASGPSA